jgi:hypothetical protein
VAPGPPLRQTATIWIDNYRDAMCGCSTRSCARDLQAGFLQQLGGMVYDDERDGPSFSEASRAALRCYAALPEGP